MHIDPPKCFHNFDIQSSIENFVYPQDKFMWELQGNSKWMYTNELLSYTSKTVAAKFGDGKTLLSGPVLRKVRDDDTGGIVYRAEAWRHFPKDLWMVVYEDSTQWKDKKDMATWRGATTGCTGCYPDKLWDNIKDDPRGCTDGKGTAKESIKNGGYASRAELIRRIPYLNELNKREKFKIGETQTIREE
jgi:hypothetical protein